MKTVKFALPALAFLFAIVASFASVNSGDLTGTEYRFDITAEGPECVSVTGTCNNTANAPVCKFKFTPSGCSETLYDVFDTQINSTYCATLLRHSLNGGVLNP
jgi:hypothetical protein